MDTGELVRACVECCTNANEYMEARRFENPDLGMSVIEATFKLDGDEAVFKLQGRISDTFGLMLRIGNREYADSEVNFQEFNEITRTVKAYPSEYVLGKLRSEKDNKVELVTDLRWLLRMTGRYFESFGSKISLPLPLSAGNGDRPVYTHSPTEQQRAAVEVILSNPLTYIWGAPGTGKTQFVLATCITELLRKGKKIAVLAPTNNAIEQVLRGLLNALAEGDPDGNLIDISTDVIRLGMSSDTFMREYPEVCERKDIQKRIQSKSRSLDMCSKALLMRLAGKDPPEFSGMGDIEIRAKMDALEKQISELRQQETGFRLKSARIVAMTPQKLMMSFAPEEDESHRKLEVDHIFIDEAGYCSALNALPAFMFGVPVTMLGDHKQLPPVCEIDPGDVKEGIERNDAKRFFFLLDRSALFAEDLISLSRTDLEASYLEGKEQKHLNTVTRKLTQSHRFGDNLAQILDRFVYRNGISGSADSRLEIMCVDVQYEDRTDRSNLGEAEAVKQFLESEHISPSDVAILTPYRNQVALLRRTLPKRYDDSILTVHRSQGREWDTVVFSVVDNRVVLEGKEFQLHLTSMEEGCGGESVINTAVSRAKRRLVIFCDRGFWSGREGELISALVDSSEELMLGGENLAEAAAGAVKAEGSRKEG